MLNLLSRIAHAALPLALCLAVGLCGCAGEKPTADGPPKAAARRGGADAPQCTDTLLLPSRGLYVVAPLNKPVPESVMALPSIEGIAIRVTWSALQPTAQPPKFGMIDEQLVAARRYNKKVSLSIEAGAETPGWVYALGARPYYYVLDDSAGDRMCDRVRMPIPWDPVYLDAFKQLIQTASRRFNRSNVLSHIKVTGLSSFGSAASLPHAAARNLSNGQKTCDTIDETAAWADVGYSRARIVGAWRELLDSFGQSFSAHRLALVLDTEGFPPIDERGQLIRGASYDTDIVPEMLSVALTGRANRMMVQSNGLTNTSAYPFPIQLKDEVSVGFQMRWAVSSDKTFRMNGGATESQVAIFDGTVRRGVAAHGKYLEVQLADALDPQLASSFAGARILLRRGPK
jgi:hypothetical protein